MDIYCTECLTFIQFEDPIAPTGSTIKCSVCGSAMKVFPSKTVIGDFARYAMVNADISTMAFSIIRDHVRDVDVFLRAYREDFLKLRNCGRKVSNELIEFQHELKTRLRYGKGQNDALDEMRENRKKAGVEFLSKDPFFNEILDFELSRAYFKPLRHRGMDTLEKILALTYENALRIKYIGRRTLDLFRALKDMCTEVVTIIADSKTLRFKDFKWAVRQDQSIRDALSVGDNIDVHAPFPSLSRWILENSGYSERNRDVFMCRMGMLGEPQMTYDNVGIRYDITRERVRQIVIKIQANGRRPLERIRLDPLIDKAVHIMQTGRRKPGVSELTEALLNCGPQGTCLRHARPFVEYLESFPEWGEAMG